MKLLFKQRFFSWLDSYDIFDETGNCEWIGPSIFNVWGYPKNKKIKTAKESEIKLITEIADSVFETCRNSACKY